MKTGHILVLTALLTLSALRVCAGTLRSALGDRIAPTGLFISPRLAAGGALFSRSSVTGGARAALSRIALFGNTMYVASGDLRIYDITDPAHPRQMSIFVTEAPAFSVRLSAKRASVSTRNGLVHLDVTDPARPKPADPPEMLKPELDENVPVEPDIVAVVGNRGYISRSNGIVEIELPDLQLPPLPLIAHKEFADHISAVPSNAKAAGWDSRVASSSVDTAAGSEAPGFMPAPKDSLLVQPLVAAEYQFAAEPLAIAARFDAGVWRLTVSGPRGQTVRVQRSSSITGDWIDWRTVTLAEPWMELDEEELEGAGRTFYRAVQ